MLNEVEMFNIRNNYMEHVVEKCEQLIIDRIAKGPFRRDGTSLFDLDKRFEEEEKQLLLEV